MLVLTGVVAVAFAVTLGAGCGKTEPATERGSRLFPDIEVSVGTKLDDVKQVFKRSK
jgi:hypothetical protein